MELQSAQEKNQQLESELNSKINLLESLSTELARLRVDKKELAILIRKHFNVSFSIRKGI
jgi:hypothetical protein